MRPSKKDELVRAALTAFQTGGYHATGVDALAEAAGMSKTSIYNHFRTKDDVILAALTVRHKDVLAAFRNRVEKAEDTPRARLLAFFDALKDWFDSPDFSGCAFIKAAAEHQDPTDPINQASHAHKKEMEALLYREAVRLTSPPPAQLAAHLMLLSEGAIVRRHMGLSKDAAVEARLAAEILIDAASAAP